MASTQSHKLEVGDTGGFSMPLIFGAIMDGDLMAIDARLTKCDAVDGWCVEPGKDGKPVHSTPLLFAVDGVQRGDDPKTREAVLRKMLDQPPEQVKAALTHKFPQFGGKDIVGYIEENKNAAAAKILLDKKYAHLLTDEQKAALEAVEMRANKAGAKALSEAALKGIQTAAQLGGDDVQAQAQGAKSAGFLGLG